MGKAKRLRKKKKQNMNDLCPKLIGVLPFPETEAETIAFQDAAAELVSNAIHRGETFMRIHLTRRDRSLRNDEKTKPNPSRTPEML